MGRAISGSSIAVLLVAIGCAAAVPVQGGANMLQRDEYGPPVAEILSRYIEDHGLANPRILDGIAGSHLLGQNRRGWNSLSGITFGESKGYLPGRRTSSLSGRPTNMDEIDRTAFERFSKRNIDEIDRTAFDSFFKRNLDEIDRVGWSGFVKRFDDYLASRQRL